MTELLLRCDCHGSHFICLSCDCDDKNPIGSMTVEGCFCRGDGRWGRIKAAWAAFRNQHPSWADIVLTRETASQIRDFLVEHTPHVFTREQWEVTDDLS
jgi:hypothetical protein